MSIKEKVCCFCSFAATGVPGPWDEVVYETDRFLVLPTKGSLVPGWLLVAAKRHAICAGALSAAEHDELRECVSVAKDLVASKFGSPTVFEHGPSEEHTALGCGIDHAHIHVVPLQFSLKAAAAAHF